MTNEERERREAEKRACDGRIKLSAWCERPGNSQARIADLLGVKPPSVHAWVTGDSRPVEHFRKLLEELTDGAVPESSWEFPSEREDRERRERLFRQKIEEGAA